MYAVFALSIGGLYHPPLVCLVGFQLLKILEMAIIGYFYTKY